MTSHYDWDTPEECREAQTAMEVQKQKQVQEQKERYIEWINAQLEMMTTDELCVVYNVSSNVQDYKTFFEVLKHIK